MTEKTMPNEIKSIIEILVISTSLRKNSAFLRFQIFILQKGMYAEPFIVGILFLLTSLFYQPSYRNEDDAFRIQSYSGTVTSFVKNSIRSENVFSFIL